MFITPVNICEDEIHDAHILEKRIEKALPSDTMLEKDVTYKVTVKYVTKLWADDEPHIMGAATCSFKGNGMTLQTCVRAILYSILRGREGLEIVKIMKIKREII